MRAPYNQEIAAGDWFFNDDGDLVVRAIGTELKDPEVFLYALHELIEAYLCVQEGVPQAAVDNFDAAYSGCGEPGDEIAAPYRTQHRRAMLIEHLMAHFMGLDHYGTIE